MIVELVLADDRLGETTASGRSTKKKKKKWEDKFSLSASFRYTTATTYVPPSCQLDFLSHRIGFHDHHAAVIAAALCIPDVCRLMRMPDDNAYFGLDYCGA